jgi:hypothetical protein
MEPYRCVTPSVSPGTVRRACGPQACYLILDRVGFFLHHGTSVKQSPGYRDSTPPRWLLTFALDTAAAQGSSAARRAKPYGSGAQRRSFLVCGTQRRFTPEPQPNRRLTYRGTDPAGQKLPPAPSDTLSFKSEVVFPNLLSSACPSADASFKPQAEIDVKSLSTVAQRLSFFFSQHDSGRPTVLGLTAGGSRKTGCRSTDSLRQRLVSTRAG